MCEDRGSSVVHGSGGVLSYKDKDWNDSFLKRSKGGIEEREV